MTSNHAILYAFFLFPAAVAALQVNNERSAAAATCSKPKMVYHRQTMAPFGFGNQYNHFVAFVTFAMLEDRVPLEEGPWSLGCANSGLPSMGYNDANQNSHNMGDGPEKHGFHQCYTSSEHFDASCTSSELDYYRSQWQKKQVDGMLRYDHEMLQHKDADEWHVDGDVVRWHMNSFEAECPTDGGASMAMSTGGGWENSAFVGRVCKDTKLARLSRLDLARYVAKEIVPLNGFDELKRSCRASWNGKKTLGIHVRRTDKLNHEDQLYTVRSYVEAARNRGWEFDLVAIATDDQETVQNEAELLREQGLDYIMFKHHVNPSYGSRFSSDSNTQFIEEIACLAEADYFVDSTKSNAAWLTQTLRTQSPSTACDINGGSIHLN